MIPTIGIDDLEKPGLACVKSRLASDASSMEGGMDRSLRRPTCQTVISWIGQTHYAAWHSEKPKIRQAYNKSYGRGLLSDSEYELIENLIIDRDREVAVARAGSRMSLGPSATRAMQGAPYKSRASAGRSVSCAPRKVRTAEERQEYVEKRGRRAFLAKIGAIPAEIIRNTCYSTCIQAVLACIAWEVINTGSCRKPVALLAVNAGVSRRTVQMALRQAAEDGLILIVRRTRAPSHVTIIDESWNRWIRTWIFRRNKQDRYNDDSYRGAEICTLRSENRSSGSPRRPAKGQWHPVKELSVRDASSRRCAREGVGSETAGNLPSGALEERLAALAMLVFADYPAAAWEDELIGGGCSDRLGLIQDPNASLACEVQQI